MSDDQLPIQYTHNKKAWMTAELFKNWLQKLNNKFKRENRKIILFLDNASSHPKIELSHILLKFFPPLCTAALQPLDQGIIRAFKAHYRTLFLKKLLVSISDSKTADQLAKQVTVLDALYFDCSVWKSLTQVTVVNCFVNTGFNFLNLSDVDTENQQKMMDELVGYLQEVITKIPLIDPFSALGFTDIDNNFHLTDEDISSDTLNQTIQSSTSTSIRLFQDSDSDP